MKNKKVAVIVATILCFLGIGFYQVSQRADGSTVESREEILRSLPIGTRLKIAKEQNMDQYLLSCVYSESQTGIAIFEQNGRGHYKLVSMECRDVDDIIISGCFIQNQWYDLIWFNGASTDYAEVIYDVDGVRDNPIIFDTSEMNIICSKAPAKSYSLEVKYYDNDGNVYW